MGIYLAYLRIEAAKALFIDAYDLAPLILPKMQDQKLLMIDWRSFSWRGREHGSISLGYKSGQYSIYDSLEPFTTLITKDAKSKIVWPSIDVHFQNWAGSMPVSLCPSKAANTPFMTACNHSQLGLPMMQTQQLLTHSWRSFWFIV